MIGYCLVGSIAGGVLGTRVLLMELNGETTTGIGSNALSLMNLLGLSMSSLKNEASFYADLRRGRVVGFVEAPRRQRVLVGPPEGVTIHL